MSFDAVEKYNTRLLIPKETGVFATVAVLSKGHLFPSAKLTFSSQWLSQDISLFLHEISLSLENSVHKTLSLFNF